jgi:hypothetical protein
MIIIIQEQLKTLLEVHHKKEDKQIVIKENYNQKLSLRMKHRQYHQHNLLIKLKTKMKKINNK